MSECVEVVLMLKTVICSFHGCLVWEALDVRLVAVKGTVVGVPPTPAHFAITTLIVFCNVRSQCGVQYSQMSLWSIFWPTLSYSFCPDRSISPLPAIYILSYFVRLRQSAWSCDLSFLFFSDENTSETSDSFTGQFDDAWNTWWLIRGGLSVLRVYHLRWFFFNVLT